MSQTIKRNAKGVRRSAAARGNAQKMRRAKARTFSFADALMRFLPFTEEQLHRVFLAVILGGGVALAWFVASLAGVPAMAAQQVASLAADSGFEVKRVEVRGVKRMNELKVYERVLGERERAMPLVDLAALRQDLLTLSWVKDARVSSQLPDTLVVDIVEREPHAVLKKPGRLVLIDGTGHELEPISARDAKAWLQISGPGAQAQVAALDHLLDAAPAIRPQVTGAEWVGNRRWNLSFKTGQVLALPQGDRESATALVEFARLDGLNQLLGGQALAFDMRVPNRFAMRLPEGVNTPAPATQAAATGDTDGQ